MNISFPTIRLRNALLAFGLLGVAAAASAQNLTGDINGTVKDSSGAAVTGARITITSLEESNNTRTVMSGAKGNFHVPLLPVGNYRLDVSMTGFAPALVRRIQLHTGDSLEVPVTLAIGSVRASVDVLDNNNDQPNIENAQASTTLTGTEVRDIPLATRNVEQLFSLQPGVTSPDPSAIDRGGIGSNGGGNRAYYSVNGQRPTQLALFLDGADLLDRSAFLADSQINTFPTPDMLREITFVRNNYGAQYASTGSALILESTRAGTDAFHGNAYFFFRNELFNANNYFNNQSGIPRQTFRYDDSGYSLGGPVVVPWKHMEHLSNTFFFLSQEILREQFGNPNNSLVPTASDRAGIVNACPTTPVAAKCTALPTGGFQLNSINPVAQEYLTDVFDTLPLPNAPCATPDTPLTPCRTLNSIDELVHNNNVQFLRIDQKINDRLTMFFRVMNDAHSYVAPVGPGFNNHVAGLTTIAAQTFGRDFMVGATQVLSPSMVLEAGYHYNPYGESYTPLGVLATATSPDVKIQLPYPSTAQRVPDLYIAGITRTNGTSAYVGRNLGQQLFVNVTKVAGLHTLQFGVNLEHIKVNSNGGLTDNNAGTFTFSNTGKTGANGFANFLAGDVASFSQTSFDQSAAIRQNIAEIYLQDDYKVLPRLTLNLGLRYSYLQLPWEKESRAYAFQPQAYNPADAPTIDNKGNICTASPCSGGFAYKAGFNPLNGIVGPTGPYGRYLSRQPNLQFAPRAGLAYSVTGDGRTVLRAGYGIYYQTVQFDPLQAQIFSNPPLIQNVTYVSPVFADPASGQPAPANLPLQINGYERNWKAPYSEAWNLDVQQQMPLGLLFDIGYVGNAAKHLVGNLDINQAPPGAYVTAGIAPAGGLTATTDVYVNRLRPYPGYESIVMSEPSFRANYHSLQAQVAKHLKRSAIFTVNYTWSKSMTDANNASKTTPGDSYNLRQSYGPSSYDRRNVVSAAMVYFLPFYEQQTGITGHLLGGWELTSLVVLASGDYSTVNISNSDPGGLGILFSPNDADRPDQVLDANVGAPHTPLEWFNTNAFAPPFAGQAYPGTAHVSTIQDPGLEQVTVGVYKNTDLNEKFRLQLRAEAFNVLNHPNFTGLDANLSDSAFGALTSAADPRELQFAVKLIF